MAGSNSAFNAENFRTVIRQTMTMGLSNTVSEQPTFQWKPIKTYVHNDPDGKPYDFTESPVTDIDHVDVRVPCAVEFVAGPTEGVPFGAIESANVRLTLLDEDYQQIVGASQVLLGENVYIIKFVEPPTGLFDVTVYTIHASALDET